MYLTVKQQVKHLKKEEYNILKELCRIAKNLTNQAIYNVRQHYFQEKQFLKYESNYHEIKNCENYKLLNSNMAQQTLKDVNEMFKSFFALIKLAKQGKYSFKNIKLPNYLSKNRYANLIIGQIRLRQDNFLTIPFSADCNGALNILRKSSVVDLSVLYGRGELDTPKRIRIS